MFYSFCWWLCMIWIRVMYHVEIIGRENVPRDRGYILAANHRTNMDPIFVAAGVRAPIRYMAKVELFQKGKLFSWLLHRLGAFPVERGKGDTGAVEWAEQVVRSGAVLGMFPEGTRSKDGTPGKPKSGVAMIASQTNASVLPCAVCYGKELRFRTRLTIRYGPLIPYERLGFSPANAAPREIKAASRLIMDEIVRLLEEQA